MPDTPDTRRAQPHRKRGARRSLSIEIRAILRRRLLAGLLVIVPLGITVFVFHFLYGLTAGRLTPFVRDLIPGPLPDYAMPAVSVILLLVALYFIGSIAGIMVGRKLIGLFEAILHRIPLVKTVYGASKQVVQAFSLSGNTASLQSVVFVDFPRPGMKSLAFITGTIDIEGEGLHYRLFIPTTPNPTSGYFEIVRPEDVYPTNLRVDDVAKLLMSGGIISPEQFGEQSVTHNKHRTDISNVDNDI